MRRYGWFAVVALGLTCLALPPLLAQTPADPGQGDVFNSNSQQPSSSQADSCEAEYARQMELAYEHTAAINAQWQKDAIDCRGNTACADAAAKKRVNALGEVQKERVDAATARGICVARRQLRGGVNEGSTNGSVGHTGSPSTRPANPAGNTGNSRGTPSQPPSSPASPTSPVGAPSNPGTPSNPGAPSSSPQLKTGIAYDTPGLAPPFARSPDPAAAVAQWGSGFVDGAGACLKGYGDLLAGAYALTQQDPQTAWAILREVPPQALKALVDDFTRPHNGSLTPYQTGQDAGRRLCAWALPGVAGKTLGRAVGAAGRALGRTGTTIAEGAGEGTGTIARGEPIEAPNTPTRPADGPPNTSSRTAPSREGLASLPPGMGDTPQNPLRGVVLAEAVGDSDTAVQLPGKFVATAEYGPMKLGAYKGSGSFGTVYEEAAAPGRVVKISNTSPESASSFPRQRDGSTRLNQIGIETPRIFEMQPGSPTNPALLFMENADGLGARTIDSAKLKGLVQTDPATAVRILNTVRDTGNRLARANMVWLDNAVRNMGFIPEGAGFRPLVWDSDFVMTFAELHAEVARGGLAKHLLNNLMKDPLWTSRMLDGEVARTPQELTDALFKARGYEDLLGAAQRNLGRHAGPTVH
jgi:hypothetical protein